MGETELENVFPHINQQVAPPRYTPPEFRDTPTTSELPVVENGASLSAQRHKSDGKVTSSSRSSVKTDISQFVHAPMSRQAGSIRRRVSPRSPSSPTAQYSHFSTSQSILKQDQSVEKRFKSLHLYEGASRRRRLFSI